MNLRQSMEQIFYRIVVDKLEFVEFGFLNSSGNKCKMKTKNSAELTVLF